MAYWGILASAIASMIIGSLWYGPLFGKTWMSLEGFSKADLSKQKSKSMVPLYITAFIMSLLTAFVLKWIIDSLQVPTIAEALSLGFIVWLGFYVTIQSGDFLWKGKSFKLYILNISYWLIVLLTTSAILFYL